MRSLPSLYACKGVLPWAPLAAVYASLRREGRPRRDALTCINSSSLLSGASRALLNGKNVNAAREATQVHTIPIERIKAQSPYAIRWQLNVYALPNVAFVS